MRFSILYILGIAFFVFSCNSKNTTEAPIKQETKQFNTPSPKPKKSKSSKFNVGNDGRIVLPDACSLVSSKSMEKYLGLKDIEVTVKDGTPGGTDTRSCFFKWEDPYFPNSGVLVQLMRNPVPDEVDEWPTIFIDSKKTSGEQSMVGAEEVSYMFDDWDVFGDDGAKSEELAKYFWRLENEVVVMVAFNTDDEGAEKTIMAEKIGKDIMRNIY